MHFQKKIQKFERIVSDSPFNSGYVAATSLKKRLTEAAPHVSGLVLDVGCGEKPHEEIFRSKISGYIGVDLLPGAYNYGDNWAADVAGNVCSLPFKSGMFDTILCTGVLPHVAFPDIAFSEFSRILKSGGILVLTAGKTWLKRVDLPIPDYWRFTDDGLRLLAEQHQMEVIYTKPSCGTFAAIGQLISRFLSKQFVFLGIIKKRNNGRPNVLAAFFILPLCALIQIVFLILDKVCCSTLDTIFYILVAKKVELTCKQTSRKKLVA